jgi:hypothetical protein
MEEENMKKSLLAGLAVGLLMAGTAIAAPYSETLLGTADDSNFVDIGAGGSHNLIFDLTAAGIGYQPGTYNPITSAALTLYFSDTDAGVQDTAKISAGLYDGNALIAERTFDLGLFVDATYKTLTTTAHEGPLGYNTNNVCVANCDDNQKDTSDDKYKWVKSGHTTYYQHSKPSSGYSSDMVCTANCDNYLKDTSDDKYKWTKQNHTTLYQHNPPSESGYNSDMVCTANCDNYLKDTTNDQYLWTKEVVDVPSHSDRTKADVTLNLVDFLSYLQDGTFTSIVLAPVITGFNNNIRLDEAYLVAQSSPFAPPPPPEPPSAPVPEPGTMMLLGIGLGGLAIFGKRRMNKEA